MVRSAINRAKKYEAKLVGDVIKNRIDAHRDSMIEQENTQFANLVAYEISVKEALEGECTAHSIDIPFYLAFGRQCYKIINTHGTGTIATEEAQGKCDLWVTRGLDGACLVAVANVFGITVTTAGA